MATVRRLDSSEMLVLQAETSVGRSPRCVLQLSSILASSIHASIRWTPEGWELKDLGSTNGTFVNGGRLEMGRVRQLAVGDKLGFGSTEQALEFVEASAPGLSAVADDGELLAAEGSVLTIPAAETPEASVFRDGDGAWQLETAASSEPVQNGHRFVAGGKHWVLALPDDVTRTRAARDGDVRTSKLMFEVSSDEEEVALTVVHRHARITLGSRASNYLLLTLARRRLADAEAGIDEKERGWIYLDELARGLRTSPEHINVDVFRVRRRLGEFFRNSAEIVQRRPSSRQLRVGAREIEILRKA